MKYIVGISYETTVTVEKELEMDVPQEIIDQGEIETADYLAEQLTPELLESKGWPTVDDCLWVHDWREVE